MNTNQNPGRRTAAIALAATGAAITWALARAAGVDLLVKSGSSTRTVGLASVVVVAVVAGLGALGVATLLGRSRRPRRAWLLVSVPLLVLSLVGPLGAATAGAGLALASMHIVVGAILIIGMSEATTRVAAPEQERRVR